MGRWRIRAAGRGPGRWRAAVRDEAFPILEFDPTARAVIEPSQIIKPIETPSAAVLAILPDVFSRLAEEGKLTEVRRFGTGFGPLPVYRYESPAGPVTLCNPGVGGAFAAIRTEDVIALGCRTIVFCGGCGVLDRDVARGHLLVVSAAVRDEGASYHYLPPAREVAAEPRVVAGLVATLRGEGLDPLVIKTWTTDGIYRETPEKIRRRRAEGCLAVEMEAASLLAVACFRGVKLGIVLCAADDVSGQEWDQREDGMRPQNHGRLIDLCAAAAVALDGEESDS